MQTNKVHKCRKVDKLNKHTDMIYFNRSLIAHFVSPPLHGLRVCVNFLTAPILVAVNQLTRYCVS